MAITCDMSAFDHEADARDARRWSALEVRAYVALSGAKLECRRVRAAAPAGDFAGDPISRRLRRYRSAPLRWLFGQLAFANGRDADPG